ncbi:hypothetical protein ACKVMT_16205 [Halobacteriales archaeon Cl-PHB]
MWGLWSSDDHTCIACGATISRAEAREYDKQGDRWDRRDKTFEYLCKPCHSSLCHQPREGLEEVLEEAGAGHGDHEVFVERYTALVEAAFDPIEEPERERER